MVTAAGGAALVGGIMSLAVVSPAESGYAGILGIADPGAEGSGLRRSPDEAGQRGSARGRFRTVLYGALGLAAAASSGSDDPGASLITAACGGGLALLSALVKSRAEKAYAVLPGRESERAGARAHPGRRDRAAASGPACPWISSAPSARG
ncbi:MAG: hypothetical protein MZV63_14275 [Marinilabiliales bacterium]|nr:hypothetical protein [Marinilabiliales bacterium]